MIIDGDKALAVFKKVKQVREEYARYALAGDSYKPSVEDLYRVVSDMYGLRISKTQVSFKAKHVRGLMERYEHEIKIRIRQDQTQEWKRFSAVKELCHVIIDEREDWSTQGVNTISDLLIEYYLKDGDASHHVTQSEVLAELAAIEILYPYPCREHDIDALAASEPTTSVVKIATHFELPQVIVSRGIHEGYRGDAAMLWQMINEQPENGQ